MADEAQRQLDDLRDETVRRMARVGSCLLPSFSPDGSRIAFISDMSGVRQVWTVATHGGWPQLVTTLDDPIEPVRWSPDGAWLAFTVLPGGGLNSQIYVVRPDGTKLRRITAGGTTNNWLNLWTHDGRYLAYASTHRQPDSFDVWLYGIETGESRIIAPGNGISAVTDISRDGRQALLYRQQQRGDNNLYLVDIETGAETLLTPHEGVGSFDGGTFSPDGQTVYLSTNDARELAAFARICLNADGSPTPIEYRVTRDDAELQTFKVSDDGMTAALVWNVGGRSDLVFRDLATGDETRAPSLLVDVITSIDFSRDGRYLALGATGATSPANVWVIDRAENRAWLVTDAPHAGVVLDRLVRPELIHFTAHDGLPLSGWLYRPTSPIGGCVLSFHGGPEAQERPLFNSTYQGLLAAGIAVLAPNVRGSSGFGKTFVNLDNGALRVNAVRDITACAEYIVATGVARAGQIGIMGGSYGGYMTMAGLTEYPDLFAAGANLFGVVNFETFFTHTEGWMAAISKVEYGDPDTEAEMLRALSPIHKLDRVIAPTLVLHGANDTNVPVIEAEQVVENLRRRGVPVEYVLYPDEGHGFRKVANRSHSALTIVRFFTTHLVRRTEPLA